MVSDLARLKKENEKLRTELDTLRQPMVIEAFAKANNMKQWQRTAYLGSIEETKGPQQTASLSFDR
jgi:hypothetical protein